MAANEDLQRDRLRKCLREIVIFLAIKTKKSFRKTTDIAELKKATKSQWLANATSATEIIIVRI